MSTFRIDDAGRVIEVATGDYLGEVEDAPIGGQRWWPLDAQGVEIAGPTKLRDLAVLVVVRNARPGRHWSLIDLER